MEIRAHYARLHALARAAGTTQKSVAARGGLAGQNSVSRLLANENLGPSVEIFVRAVEGLGKPLSQFFIEVEQGVGATLPPASLDASVMDRLGRIERALDTLGVSLSPSSVDGPSGADAQAPPGNQQWSASHGRSSLSPGIVNHNHIETLDLQRVEAIVKTSIEGILTALARLDARVAELGERDAPLPATSSTTRSAHRRRTRKPA